jgi:metal-responsive CopG/Arc/MetJ family transcriptional regulator
MKAVQLTLDENLLARLDREPEVRARGRSAFVRHVLQDYFRGRRAAEISAAYRRGYGATPPDPDEVGPWPEAQAWPEE